ncbi:MULTISPECIES: hypothetical protein [Algoriphagus]|uniref:hypothetical protein n=1 Tax=Algoriphagus TaxID=246875 RepID=UPI00047A7C9B|nr:MULTISPECIES: hypothetical protein [Algoriphagus]
MLKHRGEILEKTVRNWCAKNGFTILALSKKMDQAPSTTYRQFEKEDLPYHIIRKFGKAMGHDFRVEFPEMDEEENYIRPDSMAQDPTNFEPVSLMQAIQQRDNWKEKYYDLLEKHNELLRQKLQDREK